MVLPTAALTKTTDDAGSGVIAGATAMADGALHFGVSVDVRAGGDPSTIVIPDCHPSNGVTRVFITDKIELKLERLGAFLSHEGITVPDTLVRFLTATSFSCDAFYYTHVSAAEPTADGTKEQKDAWLAEWKAVKDAAPLLMQFKLNFNNVSDTDANLRIAKAYLEKAERKTPPPLNLGTVKSSVETNVPRLIQEATAAAVTAQASRAAATTAINAFKKASDGEKQAKETTANEAKAKAKTEALTAATKAKEASTAAASAKELAQTAAACELSADELEAAKHSGGLVKILTNSDALSELFDIEDVTLRVIRCNKESLPLLQEYAAGLSKRSARGESK